MAENHMGTVADLCPHCSEPPTLAPGAGKAGCPRGQGTRGSFIPSPGVQVKAIDGGRYAVPNTLGTPARDKRLGGWWQAQLAYWGLHAWRALEVFVHVLPGTWKKRALDKTDLRGAGLSCSGSLPCTHPSSPESLNSRLKLLAEDAEKGRFEE